MRRPTMTPRTLSMERFGRSAVAELLKGLTTQQLQRRFDELHVESPNNDSGALGSAMTSREGLEGRLRSG